MDTTLEINSEPSVQPVLQTSAPADDKKLARLLQLASARESAKTKKREREQDMSDIKTQLSTLTSALKSKTQEEKKMPVEEPATDEEPPTKRVRVTKEPIIDEVDTSTDKQESWTTMLMRSSALFGLGIGSWYFQHRFQRPDKPPVKKAHKMLPPIHRAPAQPTKIIGKSGFFM